MRKLKGFTLIEATLGITFLSILLITIAILITSISSSYTKGATLKSINTVGRSLIEDFTTSVANSPAKDLADSCRTVFPNDNHPDSPYQKCVKDNAYKFTYVQRYSDAIKIDDKLIGKPVPISGAFCTGKYSYIWNTGYVLGGEYSGGGLAEIVYNSAASEEVHLSDFRLIKIADPSRLACSSQLAKDSSGTTKYDELTGNNIYNLTANNFIPNEGPEELLSNSENSAVIYNFEVYRPAQEPTSKHILLSASFVLGTLQGGIDVTSTGDYCQTPDEGTDLGFNYCALNKFNFAMQTTGE